MMQLPRQSMKKSAQFLLIEFKLLNSEQKVQECDATEVDSSNAARYIKSKRRYAVR